MVTEQLYWRKVLCGCFRLPSMAVATYCYENLLLLSKSVFRIGQAWAIHAVVSYLLKMPSAAFPHIKFIICCPNSEVGMVMVTHDWSHCIPLVYVFFCIRLFWNWDNILSKSVCECLSTFRKGKVLLWLKNAKCL